MLGFMRPFLWLSFVCCAHATFEASEFPEMEKVNAWIAQATRSASTIGNDFQKKIPYIIVAGDQGVGKSSSINRLVQEELFPMRSKGKAEKNEPQTTVATLYTVTRSDGAERVRVGTLCQDNTCKKPDCAMQDIPKESLAEKIDFLQNTCFKGFFGVDDLITVEYSMPNAISIQIVDLPGIQQSGADKTKSKELTLRWLEKPNSIILACLRAGPMFQQEIYGMLEENVAKYKDRIIFVITKPNSLAKDNLSVLKMIESEKMAKFNAAGVILKGADTSSPEEAQWSIKVQAEKEQEWFLEHSAYKNQPDMWGIGTLQDKSHRAYLRIACSYLPKLKKQLQHELSVNEKTLFDMPQLESMEGLISLVGGQWQKQFESDVRKKESMIVLADIYARYKDKQVHIGKDSFEFDGIPQPGYSPGLQCDHPFFGGAPGEPEGWMKIAHALVQEVRLVVHKAAMRTAQTTIKDMTKLSMNVGSADHVIKKISSCEHADAIQALSRVVCSFVFAISNKPTPISEHLEMVRDPNQLPSVLIRMVMQMCVWEPLGNLTAAVRSPEVQEGLRRALDLNRFNQAKTNLKEKVEALQALLSKELPCSEEDMQPQPNNQEEPEDAEFLESSGGCGIVGSIYELGRCRCMDGLEGRLVQKGETWEGTCTVDLKKQFVEGEEMLWKIQQKEFKCCILEGSPERTKIQNMRVAKLPDTRGMWAKFGDAQSCGAMFGKEYHNGPVHFKQCKAPLKTLTAAIGEGFEDVMGMIGLNRLEL